MTLLIIYILVALGFSFLCSIAEAVLLSVTLPYVALLEAEQKPSGQRLRRLKEDINSPLAAILTLNTIAHTVGAAGAGAQAAIVFGSAYVGVASAILTLLILVFSEIIPKTLGAHYWRQLAPATAHGLRVLIWILYPFVKLTEYLTRWLTDGPTLQSINRNELMAMARLGSKEGTLAFKESKIMQNLLRLRDTPAKAAMTPRTVVFALPETLSIGAYVEQCLEEPFSRIPIYQEEPEHLNGFVLRSDLLLAQACGQTDHPVSQFRRDLTSIPASMDLSQVFDRFLTQRTHIMQVLDEHGGLAGILTLEDVLETLLGLEIVDEFDTSEDMQELARRLWKQRAEQLGLRIETDKAEDMPTEASDKP